MPVHVDIPTWLAEHTFAGESIRDRWERLLGARGVTLAKAAGPGIPSIDGRCLDGDIGILLEGGAEPPIADVHALNTREATYMVRRAEELSQAGVRIHGALSGLFIADTAHVEPGAILWSGVSITGDSHVAAGAEVRSGCHLHDTTVAKGALLKTGTVTDGATVGESATVGPFAHLREGSDLRARSKVGNFVETKKTVLGEGSKANHLTYLGNATIGEGSNIGAGTITCNYDGARKHPTHIGDGVFVGTGSALVAPLTIGDGALVAAGAVVTRDVEPGALVVARAPQKDIPGKGADILERNRRLKREG